MEVNKLDFYFAHYFLFLQLALGLSCRHGQCINEVNRGEVRNDSISKEIPLNEGSKLNLFFEEVEKTSSSLGLRSITTGFDSLQLRVWPTERLRENKLIVISNRLQKWSGHCVTYDLEESTHNVKNIKCKEINPKNGWDNLMRGLLELNVLSLPDIKNIPGNPGAGTDGESYHIEVATTKAYRFYSYGVLNDYVHVEQVRQMKNILELLQKEFEVDLIIR